MKIRINRLQDTKAWAKTLQVEHKLEPTSETTFDWTKAVLRQEYPFKGEDSRCGVLGAKEDLTETRLLLRLCFS